VSKSVMVEADSTLASTSWTIFGDGVTTPATHHAAVSDALYTGITVPTVLGTQYRCTFTTYTLEANERCRAVRIRLLDSIIASRMQSYLGNGSSGQENLGYLESRDSGYFPWAELRIGPWQTQAQNSSGVPDHEWLQADINDLRMRIGPSLFAHFLGRINVYDLELELDIVEKPAPFFVAPFLDQVFPDTMPLLKWGHTLPDAQKRFELKIFTRAVALDPTFDPETNTNYVYRKTALTSETQHRLPDGLVQHGMLYAAFIKTAVDFNGSAWFSDWSAPAMFKINSKPEVTVTGPPDILTDTAKPIVSWDFQDDEGDLQTAFRVIILKKPVAGWPGMVDPEEESLNGDAEYDSAWIGGTGLDFNVPMGLDNLSDYRAYVRVEQRAPSALESDWGYKNFSTNFLAPLTPQITAEADGTTAKLTIIPTQTNLLSADVSSLEGGIDTWIAGTNTTVAQSAAQAFHGTKSLSLTRTTSTGTAQAFSHATTGGIPVLPGQMYSAMAVFRSAVTARSCQLFIQWIDAANAVIDTTVGTLVTDTTTGWTQSIAQGVAIAGVVRARLRVDVLSAVISEVHYVDTLKFNVGGMGSWDLGGGTMGLTVGMNSSAYSPILNILTPNQSSLEINTGGWVAWTGNTTIARSTVQFLQGAASLLMTRITSIGDAQATTLIPPGQFEAVPGQEYSAMASFRAVSTGRLCEVHIAFYNQASGLISALTYEQVVVPVTDSSSGWVQATTRVVAPPDAWTMSVNVAAFGCAVSEGHYVDAIGFFKGVVTTWRLGDGEIVDTTDMEIRFGIQMIDWVPDMDVCLCHRWDFVNDRECTWAVWLLSDGKLRFDWSGDGTASTTKSATSTAAHGIPAGTKQYIRITHDADNGAAGSSTSFFKGATLATATTAIGTNPVVVATVEIMSNAAAPVSIGSFGEDKGWNGYVYELELRTTIGGTIVANPNFAIQPVGASSFTDASGRPWIIVDEVEGHAELEFKEEPNSDFFEVQRSRDEGVTWENFRYDTGLLFSDRVPKSTVPFTIIDHEIPINQDVHYRALAVTNSLGFDSTSDFSAEATMQAFGKHVWIKDCFDSAANRHFRVTDTWLEIRHDRHRRVYQPVGRRNPVVIRGSGMSDSFSIEFILTSMEEHDILHGLIDSDHLLFVQTPKGSWWCEVAAELELRANLWDRLHGEDEDLYIMRVPFQEVDRSRMTVGMSTVGMMH
jgi:hypothetical protein